MTLSHIVVLLVWLDPVADPRMSPSPPAPPTLPPPGRTSESPRPRPRHPPDPAAVQRALDRVDGAGLAPAESGAGGSGNPPRVPRLNDAPPIDVLRAAATALALAEPDRARSLVQRARLAPWLPEVRVRVDRRFGRSESLDVSPAPLADAPPVSLDTVDEVRYEARATWDLSRLVFNPDELAAHAEALRMADVRREVESAVIRLYFERRRLKVEAVTTDGNDVASNLRREARIEELEAELDALTGGALLRAMAGSRGFLPSASPWP